MHFDICAAHSGTGHGGCPMCAINAQYNEILSLRDLLNSVRAVCSRNGRDTNWEALDRRIALLNIGPPIPERVIPDSGGHIESPDCWCGPTVEEHPGGRLVIHNQTH